MSTLLEREHGMSRANILRGYHVLGDVLYSREEE